ncbi:Glycosyl hydrolases family 28 [Amycolatopsis xylanica]|uniref:Glycosyl hydrolases family 28 n=1 Tax=Amycolatopsis xylanica TaxID=589385 RepID=A0A1H3MZX0_9PSEU|nr:glycoside hydrolase family 28 protein [Amycolatopsis xylanica]SDY81755.1 Glycosyl hydrolases family 28 [Amycolatopsis xylanica]
MNPSRRAFLAGTAALAALPFAGQTAEASIFDPWHKVPWLLARIRPPRFPHRTFGITEFGAVDGGVTKNTEAFRRAITACHRAGGGRVVVPAGTFLTGPIELLSNVELHLEAGATVTFSTEPADYLPVVQVRYEGTLCYNYRPFIHADGACDIAITGQGTLDGRGPQGPWASFGSNNADTALLRKMGNDGVPVEQRVFGEGHKIRPSFIGLYHSRNILISGIEIKNPPMWSLHPVFCHNVTVENVTFRTTNSQGDGVDLDSTRYAHIVGCRMDTNDDCVVIKSGRDADGRRVGIPTRDVVVERCKFSGRWGGVTVGSEMSGGAYDIFARDCEINAPDFPGRYPIKHALYVKTNTDRGGVIDGIHLRNIHGTGVEREVLFVSMLYNGGGTAGVNPAIRNITVDGMKIDGGKIAASFTGLPDAHIGKVRVTNSTFTNIASPNAITNTDDLTFRNSTINGQPV